MVLVGRVGCFVSAFFLRMFFISLCIEAISAELVTYLTHSKQKEMTQSALFF